MFWISFVIFILFLILESIMSWIFIRKSKTLYPKLWLHAGKPTLMGNGDLISAWPLNKYLMNRDYIELEDNNEKDFARRIRLPFILSYFLALLSGIAFINTFFIVGMPE